MSSEIRTREGGLLSKVILYVWHQKVIFLQVTDGGDLFKKKLFDARNATPFVISLRFIHMPLFKELYPRTDAIRQFAY